LAEVELERVAEAKRDIRASCQAVDPLLLQRRVKLHRVPVSAQVCEIRGQHPGPGPDLERDVVAVELGEAADHAEDVLVDQEVLAELLLRPNAHGRPNASVAFASICAPSASESSPRASARAATVWTTYAGSFVFPRTGCGAR